MIRICDTDTRWLFLTLVQSKNHIVIFRIVSSISVPLPRTTPLDKQNSKNFGLILP